MMKFLCIIKRIKFKNVVPYAESAVLNGASEYPYACSAVECNPNSTVKNSP